MRNDGTTLAGLRARFPRAGRLAWIVLRPAPRSGLVRAGDVVPAPGAWP